MPKTDFKKDLKHLYGPSAKKFEVVEVPPMKFLLIDGHGDPNKHHEIYLSDPRKVAPEKLKTVLRQPVRKI